MQNFQANGVKTLCKKVGGILFWTFGNSRLFLGEIFASNI
jgi:hypothetical protein